LVKKYKNIICDSDEEIVECANFLIKKGYKMSQVVFPCKNTETFNDAFEELKEKLSSPEVVDFIIDDNCLIDDLFEHDDTFKFKEVKRHKNKD